MTRRRRDRYREPKTPELQDRNQMIVGARLTGATLAELATGFGLSRTHVHRIVAGVPVFVWRSRRSRKSRERPDRCLRCHRLRGDARALRRVGFSYREIAERLGISRGCVFNAARMVNIAELQGRAWLSHEEGRPRAWKRALLARTRPPATPLAQELPRAGGFSRRGD
jgi:DNA invertase Pin-like site-specific DNA recombinase